MIVLFSAGSFSVLAQNTTISAMEKLQWHKIMPGVWKASCGTSGLDPLEYADPPKSAAIAALGDVPFPFDRDSTFFQLTRERTSVRLPLGTSEQIYGLGLEFEGINRRENVYTLKVDHYGGVPGYTHAPVPLYISSDGYGVLINSAKRVKIHVGVGNRKDSRKPKPVDRTTGGETWQARPVSDAVEASVLGEGLEVYVFCGKSPLEAVQRYNLFCGGGTLPPKWGLGFWHRMHTQSNVGDVMQQIEEFRQHNFPVDVIGLEPGWQNFAYPCSYDWDSTRFPDPAHFVQALKKEHIEVNLWENPYVAPVSSMYSSIQPYTGSHTVWLGEVPDYTMAKAREVLLDHHQKNHIQPGVSGYKIDEVDGYDFWLWPDHATFPSGNDAVEIRQLYGLILQNTLTDHFRSQNRRTYGLVRSSYIGASSQSFVLYSDYYGHRGYITALVNSSFAGILWTPEIRSASSAEEWIRRFQSVCFSPLMMLNAWASGKKPWSYPEVTEMVRENVVLRKKLLPYLYTGFYEYNTKGIPPFRAMVLENGFVRREKRIEGQLHDAENPYAERTVEEITDQYMMGPSILVAPVFTGQTQRAVVLPAGNWYDFYTGRYVGNGETVMIQATWEHIPLFVQDGGIIPMLTDIGTDDRSQTLQVRHYGTLENKYVLYNDDGITYNYEQGDYSLTELQVNRDQHGEYHGTASYLNDGKYGYGKIEWLWMKE
jgi:alpha-D-xyloside xylohydrolase